MQINLTNVGKDCLLEVEMSGGDTQIQFFLLVESYQIKKESLIGIVNMCPVDWTLVQMHYGEFAKSYAPLPL